MIASWMLYCTLCATLLSVAALLAERALLRGRGPVRLVWIGAVVLSLLVPALAFQLTPRPIRAEPAAQHTAEIIAPPVAVASTTLPITVPKAAAVSGSGESWRAMLARYDGPLAIAWITLSLAVACNFIVGMVALTVMRRRWTRRTVRGVPIFVSQRTGPAVVGALSPSIVLPEWVLALDAEQLGLLLRHEQEHRRAGDGRLLAAAELALMLMPWNLALWWQVLRLRVAVELDCDARVLQHADARAYGDLLLEVARPARGRGLIGATAFAERAAQLERRIRVLARHRVRTPRGARALAFCIVAVAVSVAWITPRPPVPPRIVPLLAEPPAPVPAAVERARPLTPPPPTRETAKSIAADTRPQPKLAAQTAARITVPVTEALAAITRGSARENNSAGPCEPVDSIVNRLFEGVTLTTDQRSRACDVLARLHRQQLLQDQAAATTQLAIAAKRLERDAALRALLTNDADRATFDTRPSSPAGGRGRGGGDGGGGGVARGSGAGGRGGGGGARSGGAGDVATDSLRLRLAAATAALTMRQIFAGITLTSEQETNAGAIIQRYEQEIQALRQPVLVYLRVNARGLVAMPQARAAELMALVSSDADRARLESRIVSIQR